MIDTHSHIYLPDFDEDREEVMQRAFEAGITAIMMPAIDFDSLSQMEQLSHPVIQFHKMAGLHPCEVKELDDGFEEKLHTLCASSEVVGVGETGLDYYWSTDHIKEQKASVRAHCRIAKSVKKPIVLHNRESTKDLLDLIEEEQDGSLQGIWHCFNGTVEEGKRAVDLGLYLGIGGVVTFKNGGVDKTVAKLPLERMVLETDAPYLSPTPKRGKRNEPGFMKYTALRLAEIFERDLTEIDECTTNNAKHLFSLN